VDACAQSNAQLFLQLYQAGASAAELRRLSEAYLLAMQLYSGLFTGSGKTTLAHETGTASLAHRHGASFDLTLAGLLHGAYRVGDWGHYRDRITPRKRAALRAVVGPRAETYIYEFTRRPWDGASIAQLAAGAAEFDALGRDVVFLQLVEELERLSDYNALVGFRQPEAMKAWLRARREDLCRLADGLGHQALRAELDAAIERTLSAELPPEIVGLSFPGDASFRVVPNSCRKRLGPRCYQAIAAGVRRAQHELRGWLAPSRSPTTTARALRRP
jgi:(p)ppGpp synthase/HD superfamily hydrolase